MAVLFANTKSIHPKPFASSWEQLKELLSFHEENPVKASGALWSPVEYDPGTTRGNKNVRMMEAFVVDMDGEAFDHARLDGLEWFAYSTYSHRLDDPHYHLVLPLAEKVPASLWRAVWAELHDRIGLVGDPQTKDVLDTDFRLDVESVVNPVSPRSKQVRQPRQRRHGAEIFSDAWWNEPIEPRWPGLTGNELYSAMLKDFRALVNGQSVI